MGIHSPFVSSGNAEAMVGERKVGDFKLFLKPNFVFWNDWNVWIVFFVSGFDATEDVNVRIGKDVAKECISIITKQRGQIKWRNEIIFFTGTMKWPTV